MPSARVFQLDGYPAPVTISFSPENPRGFDPSEFLGLDLLGSSVSLGSAAPDAGRRSAPVSTRGGSHDALVRVRLSTLSPQRRAELHDGRPGSPDAAREAVTAAARSSASTRWSRRCRASRRRGRARAAVRVLKVDRSRRSSRHRRAHAATPRAESDRRAARSLRPARARRARAPARSDSWPARCRGRCRPRRARSSRDLRGALPARRRDVGRLIPFEPELARDRGRAAAARPALCGLLRRARRRAAPDLTEDEHYQPRRDDGAERGRRGSALRQRSAPTTGRTSSIGRCAGVHAAVELADLHLPARAARALDRAA